MLPIDFINLRDRIAKVLRMNCAGVERYDYIAEMIILEIEKDLNG